MGFMQRFPLRRKVVGVRGVVAFFGVFKARKVRTFSLLMPCWFRCLQSHHLSCHVLSEAGVGYVVVVGIVPRGLAVRIRLGLGWNLLWLPRNRRAQNWCSAPVFVR